MNAHAITPGYTYYILIFDTRGILIYSEAYTDKKARRAEVNKVLKVAALFDKTVMLAERETLMVPGPQKLKGVTAK